LDENTCAHCGGHFKWESPRNSDEEAWIGVCDCGGLQTYLSEPEETQGGLRRALLGDTEVQGESPPWIRLYRSSLALKVIWRYASGRTCEQCQQRTLFTTIRHPIDTVETHATLCLSCGLVHTYTVRAGRVGAPRRLSGSQWIPACIAVQNLRNVIYRDWWTELARRQFAFYQQDDEH
jgi:hypothetical protein